MEIEILLEKKLQIMRLKRSIEIISLEYNDFALLQMLQTFFQKPCEKVIPLLFLIRKI